MKYFIIDFHPLNSSVTSIDLLRDCSSRISEGVGSSGIEHESTNYPDFTYFLFLVGDVKVKLYLSDDDGKEGWLCIESKSSKVDLTDVFNKIKLQVGEISSKLEVYSRSN